MGSLLDDKDSFWSKAEKFADGNYSGQEKKETPPPPENDIFANTAEREQQAQDEVQKQLGEAKEEFKGEVKGFTDNDDDGDPVIDDAIIIDDDGDED